MGDSEWQINNADILIAYAKDRNIPTDDLPKLKSAALSGAVALLLLSGIHYKNPNLNVKQQHTTMLSKQLSQGGNKIKKTKRRNPKKSVRHHRHRMKSVRHRKKTLMSY
jgi:hypothetical protein